MINSANSAFDAFVQQENDAAHKHPAPTVDWAKERDDWLAALDALYAEIEGYLRPFIESGAIVREYTNIRLAEEDIGTYDAQRMTLTIGNKTVKLVPVGTLLIGSKGRVDVIGSSGTSRLVLIGKDRRSYFNMISVRVQMVGEMVSPAEEPQEPAADKKGELAWKIVSQPPAMEFTELTEKTFLQMLLDVSNG